jgi:hypothetical protein
MQENSCWAPAACCFRPAVDMAGFEPLTEPWPQRQSVLEESVWPSNSASGAAQLNSSICPIPTACRGSAVYFLPANSDVMFRPASLRHRLWVGEGSDKADGMMGDEMVRRWRASPWCHADPISSTDQSSRETVFWYKKMPDERHHGCREQFTSQRPSPDVAAALPFSSSRSASFISTSDCRPIFISTAILSFIDL